MARARAARVAPDIASGCSDVSLREAVEKRVRLSGSRWGTQNYFLAATVVLDASVAMAGKKRG